MILIDTLNPPYTEQEKDDFVGRYYCDDNIIKCDINNIIEVWQYTDDDKYSVLEPKQPEPTPEEKLRIAKEQKYTEANDKAKDFLENGDAEFELTPTFHVEASKENMNTLATAAVAIEKGLIPYQEWTSKEDNQLNLTEEQCLIISLGIGAIQSDVWNRQFIAYKNAIENATTVEEVVNINIQYHN